MADSAPPSTRAPGSRLATYAAVGAGYLVLAIVLTWPVAADLHKHVITEHLDAVDAFYNIWWFNKAVCELHASPWTNTLIDYPYGYSTILFPVWFPYNTLTLPVVQLLGSPGLPVAFNLVNFISFAACGLAMFLLVRYLTKDAGAAFVSGLVVAFCPFRLWHLTRWHVSCLELVILALYFFMRMMRKETRGAWLGFVISVSLLAYTSYNNSADLGLALFIVLVFMAVTERESVVSRDTAWLLVKVSGLVILVCSPLLLRLAQELIARPVPIFRPDSYRIPFSANLAGFITPGFNLRAYSWLAPHLPHADPGLSRLHGVVGYEIFMGYTAMALAIVGTAARWRQARLFLILAAVFILLSLGPAVHAGPYTLDLPTPFEWLTPVLPWLKIDRTPVRHSAIALISVAALAGMGLSALSAKLTRQKRVLVQVAAALAVILEFNQAPLKVDRMPLPAFVEEIKNDPGTGSVLYLPWLPIPRRFAGFNQLHHEKPLAIQLSARVEDPRFLHGPFYKYLDRPRVWLELSDEGRERALAELREEMKKRRLRYLVAYPKFMEGVDLAGLKRVLSLLGPESVLVEDELYMVYRFAFRAEE